ncbi:MAG: biotin-dependent carboxyltransferase family protein [Marmoricola sp.]
MNGFEVIDAGLLTTVQDRGRAGYAHLGVPRSGALDQGALALANRLVGNDDESAGLETTLTGCVLRARGTQVVAVTGAFADVEVDDRAMPWGMRLVVPDGGILRVGPALHGARSVIAAAGGFVPDPVLGSRSRDTLSGTGPAPLTVGGFVPVGESDTFAGDEQAEVPYQRPSRRLRLLPGPHVEWIDADRLSDATWLVALESNRVGLRLDGPPIDRRAGEIASFGMIAGAVQLPPSGQPIVLLADHATTGGYPVVAVVVPEDLDACAQWRPGDEITTRWR